MRLLGEGNVSMDSRDYETAIEHYKKCLNSTDENSLKTIAYFGLGNAYTLSDEGKEAINCFNDCLNLSSELEIKYFQHQIYLGLGSIHSTTKRLEDGIKKEEMVCLCHVALGGLNKLLENYEKSLEHYRKGFSLIENQQLEAEMQHLQLEEKQLGNHQEHLQEQEQHKQCHRPQRQKKVGGINISKDFVDHYLKNLSLVTSFGIMNGVLVVYWELAELFDKLEKWGDAVYIYEIYLMIVTEDEDIDKEQNAIECLIRIFEEEGRDYFLDSMKARLRELDKRKKCKGTE